LPILLFEHREPVADKSQFHALRCSDSNRRSLRSYSQSYITEYTQTITV
jgi:hypothetical protein